MESPSVTVIVPTHNRQGPVCRAVRSVLSQTYDNCHVLVVDDGSTDGTKRVLDATFGQNPRISYHYKSNGGVSAARNFGLKEATGDLIAFLDSDDAWMDWKLEAQVACLTALRAKGVGMIWSDMHDVDHSGTVVRSNSMRDSFSLYKLISVEKMFENEKYLSQLWKFRPDFLSGVTVYWGDIFSYVVLGNMCRPSTVLMTAERAKQAGGFNESLKIGEDHDFHLRALKTGPGAFIDTSTVNYTVGVGDQLSKPSNEIVFAESLLKTITPLISNERQRIHLPESLLKKKLAFAHSWMGRESLRHGNPSVSKSHFIKSLAYDPSQLRSWAWLALSCVPYGWVRRSRFGRVREA